MRACSPEWRDRISMWHDEEATGAEREVVEEHLGRCSGCKRFASAIQGVRVALRRRSVGVTSPRIVPIGDGARARAGAPGRSASRRPETRRPRRVLLGLLAGAAAAAAVFFLAPAGAPSRALADELVAHHVRGFAREKPCDVESSDPVAVRRWLEERLGYAVVIPSLDETELLGARLCRLGGRRTAALMYRTAEGPLTVFVPDPASKADGEAKRLAGDDVKCTDGALGAQICAATHDGHTLLAVAEASPDVLAARLRASPP